MARAPSFGLRVMVLACFAGGCVDGRLDLLEAAASGAGGTGGSAATAGASSGGVGAAAGSGAAGSGGSGGSAGAPPSPFVLDDFEDGDTQALNVEQGYWYFTPDYTCSGGFGVELTPDRADNTHAIRARGGGCTDWGALLGLDIGGQATIFDASSFSELRFWARAEPNTYPQLSVTLLDPIHFDAEVELTTEWREFVVPFSELVFSDDDPSRTIDLAHLTHLQFFVFSAEPFDFWLDDLELVR